MTMFIKIAKSGLFVKQIVGAVPTILCAAFGIFGAHRFFAGKIKSGYLHLLTIGSLGIWYVIDVLIVLFGQFTYSEEKKIKE